MTHPYDQSWSDLRTASLSARRRRWLRALAVGACWLAVGLLIGRFAW